MSVMVHDPFGVADDPEMRTLLLAIDPAATQRQFGQRLSRLAGRHGFVHVRAIRVTRYKPRRRCVIEYDVEVERPGCPRDRLTLIGKIRRRRLGNSGYALLNSLWDAGFGAGAQDGVEVPEPIGTVPEFRMWLQRKVPGRVATDLLSASDGEALGRRIAEAAHKLHRTGVPASRRHTMTDELRILHECLPSVVHTEPAWAERIRRLLEACDLLGSTTLTPALRGIHRDFYADQVIVDSDRLYLIDFDEYCEGDQALDIGNFLGSITEHSLRTSGEPDALANVTSAMEDRFVELTGEAQRVAIQAYATLTLVRHVYISTRIPGRRPFIASLLDVCEERLASRGN